MQFKRLSCAQESVWAPADLLKGDVAVNPHSPMLGVPSTSVGATQAQLSWLCLTPQTHLKYSLQESWRMLERRRKTERSSPENRGETRPNIGFR